MGGGEEERHWDFPLPDRISFIQRVGRGGEGAGEEIFSPPSRNLI